MASMQVISINSVLRGNTVDLKTEDQWMYIGKSYSKVSNIESLLSKEKRFHYTEIFQDILLRSKDEFISYIDNITSAKRDIYWWSNKISYLSPLVSDFYENYCHIKLITALSKQEGLSLIVIVEDEFLFAQLCIESFNNVTINKGILNFLRINRVIHYLYNYIKLFYFLFYSIIYLIIIQYHRLIKSNNYIKSSIIKLSWIEDRCFEENTFRDVYFAGLEKVEKEIGKSFATLTLPFLPRRLLKMSLNDEKIFPSAVLLSLDIIIKSLMKSLSYRPAPDKSINYLFNREISNKKAMFESLIFYFVMEKFLSKRAEVTTILIPFENQPNDKLLVKANSEGSIKRKVIGYQHASTNFMYLNYSVSAKFREITPLPDVIIASSQYSTFFFKSNNYTSNIVNGGSLKYVGSSNAVSNQTGDTILVLLSYDYDQSLSFLHFLMNSNIRNRNFIIKPHPNFPENLFRASMKFASNFTFVDCSMTEFFALGQTVMHNGTTAAVECINAGLKVYKYVGERIDLDPLLKTNVNQGMLCQGRTVVLDPFLEHENLDEVLNDIDYSVWKNVLM